MSEVNSDAEASLTPATGQVDLGEPQTLLAIGNFILYWYPLHGFAVVGNLDKPNEASRYASVHDGIVALIYAVHVSSPDLFAALWIGMNGYGKICHAAAIQTEFLQSAVLDVRH